MSRRHPNHIVKSNGLSAFGFFAFIISASLLMNAFNNEPNKKSDDNGSIDSAAGPGHPSPQNKNARDRNIVTLALIRKAADGK